MTSGTEELVEEINSVLAQYDMQGVTEALEKKLGNKQDLLIQQMQRTLNELQEYNEEFYIQLLETTPIQKAIVNPESLAPSMYGRMERLLELNERLENSVAELQMKGVVRRSTRQALMPKRTFTKFKYLNTDDY